MLELNKIYNQDCLEGMKLIPDNSIDSIVTDPPYELGFMGKSWDSTGIAYNVELWKECLRVLKHGGYLLAFGGTRTYHRMTCAIEDAGFEIRDQIQWIYGSGFPKSMDISKAIDKKLGAEREVVGQGKAGKTALGQSSGWNVTYNPHEYNITTSSTPEAKQWDGWGTALKPANEPIVVARKPLSEKTVAENILKWGTGGINIDDCRIGTEGLYTQPQGRFPANVIFDEEAGKLLDEQTGILTSGKMKQRIEGGTYNVYSKMYPRDVETIGDSGGASRFFYCAKASKKERGEGNAHPTVKPLKLIKYLVTLVTPPNGICLDLFEGSGTHALACKELGFDYIGFELDTNYYNIATKRIENHLQQLSIGVD